MKHTPSNNRIFWIFVTVLSLIGFVTGIVGFREETGSPFFTGNNLYHTFQMFILHHSFEHEIVSFWLELSRWLILLVFLLVTFQLFVTIIAPKFIQYTKIRFFYKNHIVICGLNEITMEIVNKFSNSKIVVISTEENHYTESLKQRKIKFISGDPTDAYILRNGSVKNAAKLFAVTYNDKQNVEIAQTVCALLKTKPKKEALQCFVLINDRELKTILEETSLFQYKTGSFDGCLFNINEIGIKYGICTNVDKILPAILKTPPEILIVGLTEKAENVIINLAHCTTMQRDVFQFTIVEDDETKVDNFLKKHHYLAHYAGIKKSNNLKEVCTKNRFDSIFVCIENQMDGIKVATEIHYLFGKNAPNILLFCDEVNTMNIVLQEELLKKKIFPINLFGKIADYVFDLDKNIETQAKETHYFWNEIYKKSTDWNSLSGHFKQSNRNQILDNYLKTYIAFGKKFDDFNHCLVSLSDNERETLAMMEHRRWVLEKLVSGWVFGERDNEFKRHDCFIQWNELSEEQRAKDYDVINLMLKLLNTQ